MDDRITGAIINEEPPVFSFSELSSPEFEEALAVYQLEYIGPDGKPESMVSSMSPDLRKRYETLRLRAKHARGEQSEGVTIEDPASNSDDWRNSGNAS